MKGIIPTAGAANALVGITPPGKTHWAVLVHPDVA